MWARIVELVIACWLTVSSFAFHYSLEESFLKTNNIACAVLIAIFSLLSFYKHLTRMHLFNLGIALWLWGLSYINFPMAASFPLENSALTGLLLMMVAIVPSRTAQLSPSWQRFYLKK